MMISTLSRAGFPAVALLVVAIGCGGGGKQADPAPAPGQAAATETVPATVTMTADEVKAAGLVLAPVVQSTIVVKDAMPGSIETPRDALAVVNTRAAGVVEGLDLDVGDRVKAGQRLAIIRSLELAEAQADYRRAALAAKFAATALERTEYLRKEGVLSERRAETDRLEFQQRRLEQDEASGRVRLLGGTIKDTGGGTTVTSPIAGVIVNRLVNRGEAVAINGPLFTVVDISRVVVQLRAPAGTPVVPGTEITFTVEALPGRTFTATVRSAAEVLEPDTRRFLIRCAVDNKDGVLKPGMFLTAQVPRASVSALTVPADAVQDMEGGPAVFIAGPAGRFERRSVELGPRADGQIAVTRGLTAGDAVVVKGAFWVRTQFEKSTLEE